MNVVYADAQGKQTTLTYSADCAIRAGWRYDDPAHPARIELCDAAWTTAQAASGSVDIVYGSATVGLR